MSAVSVGAIGLDVDVTAFLMTGVPGLILLWIREKTDGLRLPILAHNAASGIPVLF
ncbi:MAG: CPBP family glutamic-type intramembrane protease [Pseudomonadota bacterium]